MGSRLDRRRPAADLRRLDLHAMAAQRGRPQAVAAFLGNVPPPLAAAYRDQWASDYAALRLWDAGDEFTPSGANGASSS
jgi:hypothetical protein